MRPLLVRGGDVKGDPSTACLTPEKEEVIMALLSWRRGLARTRAENIWAIDSPGRESVVERGWVAHVCCLLGIRLIACRFVGLFVFMKCDARPSILLRTSPDRRIKERFSHCEPQGLVCSGRLRERRQDLKQR
ncbi:hypothetical protein BgiBS90_026351 [Biomphalaria glabrata]|nr:hypothetical protein BgiBS90_026351 [Biomphalaria glabrata]